MSAFFVRSVRESLPLSREYNHGTVYVHKTCGILHFIRALQIFTDLDKLVKGINKSIDKTFKAVNKKLDDLHRDQTSRYYQCGSACMAEGLVYGLCLLCLFMHCVINALGNGVIAMQDCELQSVKFILETGLLLGNGLKC